MHSFRRAAALMLAAVLAIPLAAQVGMRSALADETIEQMQARLEEARVQLAEIESSIQEVEASLESTTDELDDTYVRIAELMSAISEREDQLAEAQGTLAKRMSSTYKNGTTDLVSIVLGASSFDELISNVYFAEKVVHTDAETIDAVKEIKAALEQEKSDLEAAKLVQEELLERQREERIALAEREAELSTYIYNLDEAVQEAIERERMIVAEANRLAAEQAAAQAAANGGQYVTEEMVQAKIAELAEAYRNGTATVPEGGRVIEVTTTVTTVSDDPNAESVQETRTVEVPGSSATQGRLTVEQRNIILATIEALNSTSLSRCQEM